MDDLFSNFDSFFEALQSDFFPRTPLQSSTSFPPPASRLIPMSIHQGPTRARDTSSQQQQHYNVRTSSGGVAWDTDRLQPPKGGHPPYSQHSMLSRSRSESGRPRRTTGGYGHVNVLEREGVTPNTITTNSRKGVRPRKKKSEKEKENKGKDGSKITAGSSEGSSAEGAVAPLLPLISEYAKIEENQSSANNQGEAQPESKEKATPLQYDVVKERGEYSHGDPALVRVVMETMLLARPPVRWESVVGLESAKRALKETVLLPLLVPKLFSPTLLPWKGVFLYGPPGNGKTMLAMALAYECPVAFFVCSPASIISKYLGQSEKLLHTMFDLARFYSPSVIFIDEIEALAPGEGSTQQHEALDRLRSELLQQMDGIYSEVSDCRTMD
eukprot:GCRY01003355.1.p1 GENE.GCRY01003355.1~~GCRY01003355.1.p1  ORF type:complete len:385 (+),score=63.46 GCRY01003355.1:204-1358(+)